MLHSLYVISKHRKVWKLYILLLHICSSLYAKLKITPEIFSERLIRSEYCDRIVGKRLPSKQSSWKNPVVINGSPKPRSVTVCSQFRAWLDGCERLCFTVALWTVQANQPHRATRVFIVRIKTSSFCQAIQECAASRAPFNKCENCSRVSIVSV